MKIVSRVELMSMPKGVWYCEYEPQVVGGINVKDETCYKDIYNNKSKPIDWYMRELLELGCSDERDTKLESGESFSLDDIVGRDGCFADDQLYVVLEKYDLRDIQGWLEVALKVSPGL